MGHSPGVAASRRAVGCTASSDGVVGVGVGESDGEPCRTGWLVDEVDGGPFGKEKETVEKMVDVRVESAVGVVRR